MPQLYSTGPCLIWIRVGGEQPAFVGTCERAPVIIVQPRWERVYTDMAGTQVPFDVIAESQDALVSGELNRYSESLYQRMADRSALASPPVPGTTISGEIGAMMVSEGLTYELWAVFPYAPKPAFGVAAASSGSGAMPRGYHFRAAYLLGPDRHGVGTHSARKVAASWHCLRIYDPTKPGPYDTGAYYLYDFDCSAVVDLPIT